jgi:hypothetical protein
MNTRGRLAVSFAMSVAMSGCVAGCVAISGGAVELAWTVRTEDARPTDCETQGIASISLCMQDCDDSATGPSSEAGDCTGATMCPFVSFGCTRLRGTTDFDVTPGKKRLWITVACSDGTPAAAEVPEAVLRDVTRGDVTELNALLISVPSDKLACGT